MKIQHWLMLLVVLCISCKDDKSDMDSQAFDPSRPVVVSNFLPKEGGASQRMVIYGDNFGNDPSRVNVTIGGVKSSVIGVKGQTLYCIVPAKAYDGDIEVSIVDENGEKVASAGAEENFIYKKKMIVTSFLGQMYENNTKFDIKNGPFNDCGGFDRMDWFTFDPLNHNHLYVTGYDKAIRLIDFEKQYVSTFVSGIPSPNSNGIPCINFTLSGDMIVTHDQSNDQRPGNYLLTRASGFTQLTPLAKGRGTRAAAVHPVNGEYYYGYYNTGAIWRAEIGSPNGVEGKQITKVPNASSQMFIVIHPTGNYAYITLMNKHYIMRMDYDWENKVFKDPYLVVGKSDTPNYQDGVGSNVRLWDPQQGTFVKNPEYAGTEDEYDFYFCDKTNSIVRILTPQGKVSTFAGRPSVKGYMDGDLRLDAIFNAPASIIYDEERNCFFVGDLGNHRIRKIAYED